LWQGSLDAIGSTDDALLQLTATLPPNFGYVMADCNLTLAMAAAGTDWDAFVNLNLQNYYRAAPSLSVGLSSNWVQRMTGAAQDLSTKSMVIDQAWPTFPIIGTAGTTGVLIVLSTFNNAGTARSAGVINGYISFWVFDLEQIRKFPINSPVPTHSR
jgi:hypothetical protein